jgi:hypothetical protein
MEVSKGGKHSDFGLNEITSDYRKPHLAINQMNLFLFSQINESFSVNARLQFDTWSSGLLNPLRLSLAEIMWAPSEGLVQISVGRFVNPFGLYPQRQLSIQNLFVNTPLAYGYAINVTNQHGIWYAGSSGYDSGSGYGEDATKLTTISFAGYTTGVLFSWLLVPGILNLDLALTNVALTSQKHYTNLQNIAGIARLALQPVIFWQQGISFSYGSFMERSEVNAALRDLEQYKQTVIGSDWVFAYTYFELSGEYIHSFWKIPAYDQDGFLTDTYGNVAIYDLENYSFYIDLKYEPSFMPGSYLAVRFEELHFKEYKQDYGYYAQPTQTLSEGPWDNNVRRYTVAAGYKLSSSIQLKVAYSDQELIDTDPDPEAYTLRSFLSASF